MSVNSNEFNLSFNTNVTLSIQESVQFQKPLMMLIKDDTLSSTEWCNSRFLHNNNLSHFTKQILIENFIRLQIFKDSNDFNNLLQIFPKFKDLIVPCVLFVFSGQIVDSIDLEFDPINIDDKIKHIYENLNNYRGRGLSQEQPILSARTFPATDSETETITNETMVSQTPVSVLQTPQTSLETQSSSNIGSVRTLREESKEFAAAKYREQRLKQHQQDRLERQRILKLMKCDREEKRQETLRMKQDKSIDEQVRENLHNSELRDSSTYKIQIKLLDGHTVRADFPKTDRLHNVREFVVCKYAEYQELPFYFFKNVDRITYGDADEGKSLEELNLNKSTLILKPLDPEEPKKTNNSPNVSTSPSTFGWIKNRFNSYMWPTLKRAENELEGNGTFESINGSLGHSTGVGSLRDDEVEESDNDTIYHSPLLRSRSSSPFDPTSTLHPSMSSFSLYGSQGLIAGPRTSSLRNEIGAENNNVEKDAKLNDSEIQDDSSINSRRGSAKVYTVRNLDDNSRPENVMNGNNIALQHRDDDK